MASRKQKTAQVKPKGSTQGTVTLGPVTLQRNAGTAQAGEKITIFPATTSTQQQRQQAQQQQRQQSSQSTQQTSQKQSTSVNAKGNKTAKVGGKHKRKRRTKKGGSFMDKWGEGQTGIVNAYNKAKQKAGEGVAAGQQGLAQAQSGYHSQKQQNEYTKMMPSIGGRRKTKKRKTKKRRRKRKRRRRRKRKTRKRRR